MLQMTIEQFCLLVGLLVSFGLLVLKIVEVARAK